MGGQLTKRVNDAAIQEEVNQAPVVMYSKPLCGYCKMAREVFRDEGIEVREKDLDLLKAVNPSGYQDYLNGLVYTTRVTTVPQIFICGKFIGGYTELAELRDAQNLWKRVEECMEQYERVTVQ